MGINIDEFIKERNSAMLSFDRQKIEEYMRKYHLDIPEQEGIFWVNAARAVLAIKDLPAEAAHKARAILKKYRRSECFGRDLNYTEIW